MPVASRVVRRVSTMSTPDKECRLSAHSGAHARDGATLLLVVHTAVLIRAQTPP
jgi:hypothetical protein